MGRDLKYIVMCRRGGVSFKPPGAPGSDKTQGQGSFGPFIGGLNLTHEHLQHGLHTLKYRDKANLIMLPKNFKKKNGPYTGPVLLRPGTSQYL